MGDVYRDMEYYLRITNHMISIGTSILDMPQDFVKTWVSARRENAGARLLKDYFEADSSHNPSVYIVDSAYRKDMRQEIEKHNRSVEEDRKIKYLFVSMENGQTLLITRDRDEREMDQVMNNMKEKGIHEGVLSEEILYNNAEGSVMSMSGLNALEAELLLQKAKENGIALSIRETALNEFKVSFKEQDKEQMAKITTSVFYDLSKDCGELYGIRITYQKSMESQLHKKIDDLKEPPFYVIDQDGKTIGVSGSKFYYKEPGKKALEADRTNPKHRAMMHYVVNELKEPVILTSKEYKELQMTKEKDVYLERLREKQGKIKFTEEEIRRLNLHEKNRNLYEQKLLLGNPLQDYVENLLSNDEVEIDEFVRLNHMNEEYDLSEEIIKDVNERQARIKVQIEEEQHDLDMEREDVYEMELQEDREEIILSDDDRYLYEDRNGDGISDIYQDENANGIPDWQEEERE
ncbi:MAG: hypothetical protein Q4E53_05555 [Eubacteriales bacterium]|nr:hypothetical protein [Eubacteriales bacterium]